MFYTITQSASLLGKRDKNEDELDIINNINYENKNIKRVLYGAVFDGHGGGNVSKIIKNDISSYFTHMESKEIKSSKEYNEYINKIFKHIQKNLINKKTAANNMGSTCLISLLYPKNNTNNISFSDDIDMFIKIINLGDCRAVICNKYYIGNPLSRDHKPTRWDELIRIGNEGGIISFEKNDDPRISGLSVSRCFGDLDCKYISQIPDIYDYKLDKDKFLILACDGVWDVLSNQEAVDFVIERLLRIKKLSNLKNKTIKSKGDDNIANQLANYALERGSTDNLSINIIFFVDNLKEFNIETNINI